MKYKHIVSAFLIGLILYFFGAWAKITHQAYAVKVVNIAFAVLILSCILALIKVLSSKKDDVLNK